jgi:beta-lactamase regulating signal transducer with metallopeptidase domain
MNPTLIYLIKVNIGMALFYMFYRLFFANDTFWKTRRLYLIFSILISFIYPVFSIVDWLQNQQPIQNLVTGYVQLQEFTITANVSKTIFTLENTLLAIYILVTTVLFVRLLTQLFAILNIYLKYKKASINQQEIIVVNKDITPFSFFGNIYLNPNLHSKEELNQILIHELTHVRQWHSMDVLVSEMACIAFWFNPAVWLLKKEIRQNLEYLADDKVIKSGFDSKSYQYHLIQLSYQTSDYRLTNNFNVLPLKKRIIMMNQQKSRKTSALKY